MSLSPRSTLHLLDLTYVHIYLGMHYSVGRGIVTALPVDSQEIAIDEN